MLSRQLKVLIRSTLKIYFFGHLNENFVRIKNSIKEHLTFLISETKIDYSFPNAQFKIEG